MTRMDAFRRGGALSQVQALAEDVLAFLRQQRLAPTPQNFTLAYLARSGSNAEVARAVDAITEGGVRMSQDEADAIFATYLGAAPAVPEAADDGRAAVRHQTLRLAEIAADAAAATGAFNRDLSAGFQGIEGGAANVLAIIAAMIERSQRAEQELAATAGEVEALRQELDAARDDASKDALTGLGNRRAIDAHLARLGDAREPRLLAICDVDRFKSINDRYGHPVGDRVLKAVGGVLAKACAPHLVGRWGGEEFMVVMAGVELDEGAAIVDAAREELASRSFRLRETDEPMGPVTFSAGVTLATGNAVQNAAAIERADAHLYRAKAEGRNRVLAG